MKLPFLSFLCLLPMVEVCADETVYLDTNFETGIPTDFILSCEDMMCVDLSAYSLSSIGSEWFTSEVEGTDGKAVLSASRREDPERTTDNRLITPLLHIDDPRAYFRWDARSIHHDLRDGYTVMISPSGDVNDLKPVITIDEENYQWTTRLISLTDYVGKDIRIAIVHNATNRFLLAVDNLFVGYSDTPLLKGRTTSRHFVGNEGCVKVTGQVTNYSGSLHLQSFTLTTSQGTTYTIPYNAALATGDTAEYEFDIPVSVGNRVDYTVSAVTSENKPVEVVSDFLVCSYYPRTLLLEKYTGMWCNSCPTASPLIYRLEDLFGDQVAVVEVHGFNSTVDPMSNDAYIRSMGVSTYPTIMFNRRETKQSGWGDESTLNAALAAPTTGYIESDCEINLEGCLSVTSRVRFAQDTDNTDGRYRVGYLLREPLVRGTDLSSIFKQKNGYQGVSAGEFHFLPSSIPSTLINFHNVARGGEESDTFAAMGGESGVRGSLPAEMLKSETDYKVNAVLDIPATVIDKNSVEVVAVLFKMTNVVNVALAKYSQTSAIREFDSTEPRFSLITSRGTLSLKLDVPTRATVCLYSIDGRCAIAKNVDPGMECRIGGLAPGYYVLKIFVEGKTITRNIILS